MAVLGAVTLTVALLSSVASATTARSDRAPANVVAPSPTFSLGHKPSISTAQVITALATEGVGVYASPSATSPVQPVTAPVVPLRVLQSQAAAYAAETLTGSGTLGSQIDALSAMPAAPAGKAYVPFAYLLAAYATSHATAGEVLAGHLLGTQDWARPGAIVFPDLVLALFTADALRAAQAGAHAQLARAASDAALVPADLGSLCSTLSNWVSSAYDTVFNALTVGPSSNAALNFIGGLWDKAVALARSAISNIATLLTSTVVSAITKTLGVIGVASWVISSLRNMTVTTAATPPTNAFGVDPAPALMGKLVITVGNPGDFNWPAGVTECAQDLGLDLPSFSSVLGHSVAWSLTPMNGVPTSAWCTASCELATEDTAMTETSLEAGHTARFSYQTNTETADQASRGSLITDDSVLVHATVSLDTSSLAGFIRAIVLGGVPGAVRVVVGPLFDSLTSGLLAQLASLVQPTAYGYVQVRHHALPRLLPDRTCEGLLSAADFPGTADTGELDLKGGVVCSFAGGTPKAPTGAEVTLKVLASTAAADGYFITISTTSPSPATAQYSKLDGVGDEAVSGTVCSEAAAGVKICGPAVIVRVVNDVFTIGEIHVNASVTALAAKVVSELCSDCKFPTSPAP